MSEFLYTIPYSSFDLWDVKRYSKITYTSRYSIEPLGRHIRSEIEKINLPDFPEETFSILGISNEIGMHDAYDKKGKEFNQPYKIVKDGFIIAICDFFVSILSSIVLFTTLFGTGLEDKIGTTGIATAFIVYPQAIVNLSSNGVINAIFGIIFYLCLGTLAIDSAFSITEGVSTAISDKFKINKKNTTFF